MFSPEEHLDDLVRHIERVRENCLLLGKRLIASGRVHFGRLLIARGFVHDASKFHGIEWEYMRPDDSVPEVAKQLAIEHHRQTNAHLGEWWARALQYRSGGRDRMLLPASWSPSLDELVDGGVRGVLFVQELSSVRAGTAGNYLDAMQREWRPVLDRLGVQTQTRQKLDHLHRPDRR